MTAFLFCVMTQLRIAAGRQMRHSRKTVGRGRLMYTQLKPPQTSNITLYSCSQNLPFQIALILTHHQAAQRPE